MRYHFRREIFTLGIPCAIALIFVLWSLHSGFASTANPLTSSAQSTNATIRNLEVEALGGNLSAGKGIHTSSLSSASAVTSPVKGNLYLTVVIAPVIALLPYSIDVSREERKRSHYEQEFADFLFEMSELVRVESTPQRRF